MKRLIAAILTATAMTLAACTATAGTGPSTTPEPTTTASPPVTTRSTDSVDPVESWLSGTTTHSTAPRSTSTTAAVDAATTPSADTSGDMYDAIPVTIPDTITGAGRDAANAAIPVWRNAVRLYDESMQDPDTDWKGKIRKFVADPAAITQLKLVSAFARDGVHQTGSIRYVAEVTVAAVHNVQIRACVDIAGFDVVNSDGLSISKPSTPGRFYRDFNLDFYPDAGHVWLLNLTTTPKPVEPC